MKIFNWMHRKFHQNNKLDHDHDHFVYYKKDGLAYNVKATETVANDTDPIALLDNVTIFDMWKDGILTIGTLGFDPFKLSLPQIEYTMVTQEALEEEQRKEKEEYYFVDNNGELNASVMRSFKHEFKKVFCSDTTITMPETCTLAAVDAPDTPLLRLLEPAELITNTENDKKKRTTLADLFSADSDIARNTETNKVPSDSGKKAAGGRIKDGMSVGKKHVPNKKNEDSRPIKELQRVKLNEDSRPIKELQRMITKMLKKQIHPDIEEKMERKRTINSSTMVTNNNLPGQHCTAKADDGVLESISLLQGRAEQKTD